MGGTTNKTALAAMQFLKRATLQGEEVAAYLDVAEFLKGIHDGDYLVISSVEAAQYDAIKAENAELKQQEMLRVKTEAIDDYVAPITPEEAGLDDLD